MIIILNVIVSRYIVHSCIRDYYPLPVLMSGVSLTQTLMGYEKGIVSIRVVDNRTD